jgi:hypothetical protein
MRTQRFEVKWLVPLHARATLEAWLGGHELAFGRIHDARTVSSAYYDTPFLDDFAANLAGLAHRQKVRLRWYGESWAPAHSTLEVKGRINFVGWKAQHPVAVGLDFLRMPWRDVTAAVRNELRSGPLLPFLDGRPDVSVITRYLRHYYVSRDGKVRVTIDDDVAAFAQIGHARPQLRFPELRPELIVVELKCATDDHALGSRAVADLPWRPGRHSKYASAVDVWIERL